MAGTATDWLSILLGAGCLLAGTLTYTAWTRAPFDAIELTPAAGGAAQQKGLPAWEMQPAEAFAQVLERPLFTEGRRPPRPEVPPVATAREEAALAVVLTAVILAPDRRLAVVETSGGKTETLSLGDAVDGWRLVEIGAEHLTFDSGGRVKRFALKDLPDAGAPITASAEAVEQPTAPADALGVTVTIDGRQVEILPEHLGNRGEGSILASVPDFGSESNNP
jgi:hypothetical protein